MTVIDKITQDGECYIGNLFYPCVNLLRNKNIAETLQNCKLEVGDSLRQR